MAAKLKGLIDLNVILDVLQRREPLEGFYDYVRQCTISMPDRWRETILAYEPGLQ